MVKQEDPSGVLTWEHHPNKLPRKEAAE